MAAQQLAQGLASLGRNGDSTLVHMQPHEVAGLQALAEANGTSLSINPHTGLPEAFSLGGFFRSLLPTVAGFGASAAFPGAGLMAGILAGSATGALTNKDDPLMGAVMGGLGGYGGVNLGKAAAGFTPNAAGASSGLSPEAVKQAAHISGTDATTAMLDPQVQSQLGGANLYSASAQPWTPSGITNAAGEIVGPNMGLVNPVTTTAAPTTAQPAFGTMNNKLVGEIGRTVGDATAAQSGLGTGWGNIAADPMGFVKQNAMEVAMPIGGALLEGMAPADDLSLEEQKKRAGDVYDPYASLDLSGDTGLRLNSDTGLRLFASGGPVSFDDGGMPSYKLGLRREGEPMQEGLAALAAPMPQQPMYADGGSVTQGGLYDLYARGDQGYGNDQLSRGGYGIGRLERLTDAAAADQARTQGFSQGGAPTLEDGGFVVPADVVFYAGGHSTAEGQKKLAKKYGAVPIRGPGNGLSDDIHTTIEGKQPARVANGESYIPMENVEKHGGAEKFYKMMDKVRKQATGSKKQAKPANV